MKVINHSKSLKEELSYHVDKKVGFVPTMGALHMGHISLVDAANKKSEFVIVSIFVNPTQFDNKNDLNNYPITLKKDLELLKSRKVDVVFCPTYDDLYSQENKLELSLNGLNNVLEGEMRDGHFDGVIRVLSLFFKLINPSFAFFGEKDYQQFLIVSKLAEAQFPDMSIVACSTFREKNGLAMSSRNLRLSINDRIIASKIYDTLNYCRTNFKHSNTEQLKKKCFEMLKEFSNPEYFEIRDAKTLSKKINRSKKYRAFVATKFRGVRLIDNLAIN